MFPSLTVINALSQRYFLQASDQKDLQDWVEALNRASKITVGSFCSSPVLGCPVVTGSSVNVPTWLHHVPLPGQSCAVTPAGLWLQAERFPRPSPGILLLWVYFAAVCSCGVALPAQLLWGRVCTLVLGTFPSCGLGYLSPTPHCIRLCFSIYSLSVCSSWNAGSGEEARPMPGAGGRHGQVVPGSGGVCLPCPLVRCRVHRAIGLWSLTR